MSGAEREGAPIVLAFERRGRGRLEAELGAVLSEGATSFVHAARTIEPRPGQPAAFVAKRAKRGAERVLERERASCARFDHPNVVAYLGSARDPDQAPVLAFEKLEANPLLLSNQPELRCGFLDPGTLYYPLPPGTAIELAFDLIRALEHLHAHGCVHGDVKLANFMVRVPRPGEGRAVLAQVARSEFEGVLVDMGSVRSLEQVKSETNREGAAPWLLRDSDQDGAEDAEAPSLTPIYAPPEVLLGDGPIASRIACSMDVYAFALVLHVFLTGRAPYSGLADAEWVRSAELLLELKAREQRGELSPIDEAALDELPLHDVAVKGGARGGFAAWRSGVAHLLRRCTDPDPRRRMDAAAARSYMEKAFAIRADPRAYPRGSVQDLFQMRPHANRLTGDRPLGRLRVNDQGEETALGKDGKAVERRDAPRALPLAHVLGGFHSSGFVPEGDIFACVTTGDSVTDVLASKLYALDDWLALDAVPGQHVRVGRAPENDIVVEDRAVSKLHVVLESDERGISLADQGSSNGTVAGSTRLVAKQPHLLSGSAVHVIRLGPDTVLTLLRGSALEGFLRDALEGTRATPSLKEPGFERMRTQRVARADLKLRIAGPERKGPRPPG